MNRQEALVRIERAGKSAAAIEATHRLTDVATVTYSRISDNPQWSDEYKRQLLAIEYLDYKQQADKVLFDLAGSSDRTEQVDAERVFGVIGLSGDSASLMISRRDAGDRVSSVVDPRELSALLAKATRSGDEVLARAIAERATEIGDADTMNTFLDGRPALQQAGERLWNSQQQDDMAVIALGFQLIPAKPAEFGSTQEWEIDRLAQQEPVA